MKTALRVAAFAMIAFHAVNAAGFVFDSCDNVPVVWTKTIQLFKNEFSIPSGSARESAYFNTITRWNNVPGMRAMFAHAGTTSGSTITIDDGQNDVIVVPPAAIGNNAGMTFTQFDSCDIFGDQHIVEADVAIASAANQSFLNPNEAAVFLPQRMTFLHEFGHALGLDHSEDYNVMRANGASPFVGGTGEHADILPDDALGGRFLYGQFATRTNVFASAQIRFINSNTIASNTGAGPVIACSGGGGKLNVLQTVGNNGSFDMTQTERWFVSTNKTAYSSGIFIGQWNNSTYFAHSALSVVRKFIMPKLAPGTYFLFHGVNQLHQFEPNEADNVSREGLIINVVPC